MYLGKIISFISEECGSITMLLMFASMAIMSHRELTIIQERKKAKNPEHRDEFLFGPDTIGHRLILWLGLAGTFIFTVLIGILFFAS